MLKVMIIDDEPTVREGLKTVIDWESYGYFVCGEGIDGFDALDKMESLEPDLVLVDIKMPEMDGLQFIRSAREKGHKAKFIILTGYSDFEYTKKAIQLGVNSYLLKPVEESELIDTVKEIHDVIQKENEILGYVHSGKKYSQENIVRAILRGGSVEMIKSEVYFKGLDKAIPSSFQVAVISGTADKIETGNDFLNFNRVSDILSIVKGVRIVLEIEGRTGIIFMGSHPEKNKRDLQMLLKHIRDKYTKEILISLGRTVKDINDIKLSYDDSLEIINNKFFFDFSGVVVWEEQAKNEIMVLQDTEIQVYGELDIALCIEKLFAAIELEDREKCKSIIAELFAAVRYKKYPEARVKGLCVNVLNEIYRKSQDYYPILKNKVPCSDKIMSHVYDRKCFAHLMDSFSSLVAGLMDQINSLGSVSVMKKIQTYIDKNYNNEITLEMIGNIFGYNSGYLGKAFKSYTGYSFNAYLEKLRIEKAKELLHEGYKVYEIVQKTGFKNVDYFYFKFKKYVGVSTSDYKKTLENQSNSN